MPSSTVWAALFGRDFAWGGSARDANQTFNRLGGFGFVAAIVWYLPLAYMLGGKRFFVVVTVVAFVSRSADAREISF